MTEEQIERAAESSMNGLDAALMRGDLTQAEYEGRVRALDRATEAALSRRTRGEAA